MSKKVIEATDVQVVLQHELILKDVNISVFEGETVVLVGPSGSGKSVLLKTLAGVIEPYRGDVFCYGQNWNSLDVVGKHKLSAHVGVQFQKGALFDSLTAFENVAFPLREHSGFSEEKIRERVEECLANVSLEKAAGLLPHMMSGGMRQRLGIARAIALKPEILFLDDPTAGLDPLNTDQALELVKKLKQEIGATLIMVTHSMGVAYDLADRIFLVADQTLIETGDVAQTKAHTDARVQQFIHGRQTGPLKF